MEKLTLGFLGLGAMGGPMAQRLVESGHRVHVFDPDKSKADAVVKVGATAQARAAEVAKAADVVMMSLPLPSVFVTVMEGELLPQLRAGHVLIDLGTSHASDTRRFAEICRSKGAALLDAPLTGGARGSREGNLTIFAGGDRDVFDRCKPLFDLLTPKGKTVYCGPSGAGQIVKGCNQLAMGLNEAMALEAVMYGVLGGVDPEVIGMAVGDENGASWRRAVLSTARKIKDNSAGEITVKQSQLADFLEFVSSQGFELPMTAALEAFCRDGEKTVMEANRPAVSFYKELLKRKGTTDKHR